MTATGQSNKLLRLLYNYYSKKIKIKIIMYACFLDPEVLQNDADNDTVMVNRSDAQRSATGLMHRDAYTDIFFSLFFSSSFFFFLFLLFHLSHPSQESHEDSVRQEALCRGSMNTVQLYCTSGEIHLLTSSSKRNKTFRIISTDNKILHINCYYHYWLFHM